jgi:hypothetical protein
MVSVAARDVSGYRILIPPSGGSNPPAPANRSMGYERGPACLFRWATAGLPRWPAGNARHRDGLFRGRPATLPPRNLWRLKDARGSRSLLLQIVRKPFSIRLGLLLRDEIPGKVGRPRGRRDRGYETARFGPYALDAGPVGMCSSRGWIRYIKLDEHGRGNLRVNAFGANVARRAFERRAASDDYKSSPEIPL